MRGWELWAPIPQTVSAELALGVWGWVAPEALRVGRLLVRSGSSVVNAQQPRVFERPEALSG